MDILYLYIGDDSSLVITHISDSGVLTAHIKTCNETYYIEVSAYYKIHVLYNVYRSLCLIACMLAFTCT